METLFIHRLKVVDVAKLEENAGGGLRQRKCASKSYKIVFAMIYESIRRSLFENEAAREKLSLTLRTIESHERSKVNPLGSSRC